VRFGDVVARTWRDNRMFSVLLELTYRCNLDCFFCYNDLGLAGAPLSRAQYDALLAELAELGTLHLTLSGGEPLAHPDFLAVGARARELGFVVRIKSNGHALRGEMLRRIVDQVDPFVVEVSLHGAQASTHDLQTRVPGSFDRLLANLREALNLGVRVRLKSTLTRWNEEEIEGMLDLAQELGSPLDFDPEVTPRDDGDREPLSIAPSRQGIERLFRVQAERARRGGDSEGGSQLSVVREGDAPGAAPVPLDKHCGAGSAGVAIDPYGNVYPCVQWRRAVGNLHQQSIREIWEQSTGLDEIRRLTVAAKQMVDGVGPGGALMSFCPGSAATRTGDPLRIYPELLQRKEIAETVLAAEAAGDKSLLPIVR
jgi:MoaA/NifB/PqqE/SkfB family radical SAM enzyme